MLIQIHPSLPVLWRTPHEVQVGFGGCGSGPIAVGRFEDRALALLVQGVPESRLEELARDLQEVRAWRRLRAALAPALVLTPRPLTVPDASRLTPRDLQPGEIEQGEIEQGETGAARGTGTAAPAWERVRRLERAHVHVDGLGTAGSAIAAVLAQLGVGTITGADERLVGPEDAGLVYRPEQVGAPRRRAFARAIDAVDPARDGLDDTLEAPHAPKPDLGVVVGDAVLHPEQYRALLSRDVPHIGVVFEPRRVLVTPPVVPGSTPCLTCWGIERARAGADPEVTAAQLHRRRLALQDPIRVAAVAARAASAARRALADEGASGWTLEGDADAWDAWEWPDLPSCGCRLDAEPPPSATQTPRAAVARG